MTAINFKMITRRFTELILAVVLTGLTAPQWCQAQDVVLLLQQSPAEGGTVTPEQGVHHFSPDTYVTLTATPKAGYQFVYWLGDVSDPTAASTMVRMDTPKIVIAVFQPIAYETIEAVAEISQGAPIGGAFFVPANIYRQGMGSGTGPRPPQTRHYVPPKPPEPPVPPDFPVPGEENDFPVPVPEPTTAGLLLAGAFLALAGRRTKTKNNRM